MEPYEADQSDATQVETYDENQDDAFGEDGMDEGAVDDPDYSTMLKGEDEPQASTSGDALGEGQGTWNFSFIGNYAQIIYFVK